MKTMLFSTLLLLFGFSSIGFAETMAGTMSPQDTAATLNALAATATDGEKGFAEAAKRSSSEELKTRFTKEASERKQFADQLKEKIKEMGEDPASGGTIGGTVQRVWIDLTTAVAQNDDKAVLGAVKTGEEQALDEYRDALSKNLPQDVRNVVQKQTAEIESSYDWTVNRLAEEKQNDILAKDQQQDIKEQQKILKKEYKQAENAL